MKCKQIKYWLAILSFVILNAVSQVSNAVIIENGNTFIIKTNDPNGVFIDHTEWLDLDQTLGCTILDVQTGNCAGAAAFMASGGQIATAREVFPLMYEISDNYAADFGVGAFNSFYDQTPPSPPPPPPTILTPTNTPIVFQVDTELRVLGITRDFPSITASEGWYLSVVPGDQGVAGPFNLNNQSQSHLDMDEPLVPGPEITPFVGVFLFRSVPFDITYLSILLSSLGIFYLRQQRKQVVNSLKKVIPHKRKSVE